jgi:hypothetical protein
LAIRGSAISFFTLAIVSLFDFFRATFFVMTAVWTQSHSKRSSILHTGAPICPVH